MSKKTVANFGHDYFRRLAGICGLVGSLLFFVGDMLFYGYLGSGSNFDVGMRVALAQASTQRLFAGGLVGPPAACLCIAGFWHVYLNVRPSSRLFGQIMLAAFFVLMVGGSAVHTLWTAKGLALKYCDAQGSPCTDLLTVIRSYWTMAYYLDSFPGYVGGVILMGLVLTRKTWYPRWTALANPGVLLLLSPIAERVPSPLGAILVGGATNLSFVVFFVVSVITSWTHHVDSHAFANNTEFPLPGCSSIGSDGSQPRSHTSSSP